MTLSTNELAQLRTDAGDYLPDTCTILRDTETLRSTGDVSRSQGTVATGVACRMMPTSYRDRERLVAAQITTSGSFWLSVAHNQDVVATDRVVFDGETYEIAMVEEKGSWKVNKRAICTKVEP